MCWRVRVCDCVGLCARACTRVLVRVSARVCVESFMASELFRKPCAPLRWKLLVVLQRRRWWRRRGVYSGAAAFTANAGASRARFMGGNKAVREVM